MSSSEFKLVVAGSRGFNDYDLLSRELMHEANEVYAGFFVSIVSGMARGADRLAVRFAEEHGVRLYKYPAEWDTLGMQAGFIRNAQMAKYNHGLLAFWDGQSRGTAHMIQAMRGLNKPVTVINY